ncbi:hypothetical protein DL764_002794 [Monosporascus ibericus]|uniref:B30.2/SPRY domain-containing protein n=1 Tax=Monosporascus ibericus TaxID=155417 RepID=A0A4Q4TJ59_9PEZI|nr:hypothetical protein DL764_002794 [Monosporascus ibericus]
MDTADAPVLALQRKNRQFHVVTVHGIAHGQDGGDATGAAKSLGKFASECYGSDRTTNFTYHPQPCYDILSMGIHEVALDLLKNVELKVERDIVPSLVFIGQDLGGIIIKRALLISLQDNTYSRIAEMASILVFLGTPHRASEVESWESIAAKLILQGPHAATCALSEVVKNSAPVLKEISQRFNAVCTLYSIISFHDPCNSTDALTFSRDTAIMGSYNENVDVIGDSRVGIATVFSNCHDTSKTFARQEKFMHVVEAMMARTRENRTSHLKCLSMLSQLSTERSQANSNRLYLSDSGFFEWLFDTNEYKLWRERRNAILLLHSSPETELAAALLALQDELNGTLRHVGAISFFFQPHDDRFCSFRNLVASLSRQLLILKPSLFTRVQTLCDELVEKPQWRTDQLWALFRALLSSPDLGDIVCFVHMVDQCDDIPKEFLEEALALSQSLESGRNFKFVITSADAPDNHNSYSLGKISKDRLIRLDLRRHGQGGKDVEPALLKELDKLIRVRPELASFGDVLVEKLNSAALGSLGLSLTLRLLQARRPNLNYVDLKAEISSIPVPLSLPRLFECYLERIPPDRLSWARHVFSWMALAYCPLSLPELAVAIALQGDHPTSLLALRDKMPQNLATDLQQTLGNLVTIENGEATLADGVFREFLLAPVGQGSKVISLYNHKKIAEACVDYLSLVSENENGVGDGEEYSLCAYATRYWPKHYNMAEDNDTPEDNDMARENDSLEVHNKVLQYLEKCTGGSLLSAVRLQCADLVRSILGSHSDGDYYIDEALKIAIENGDEDILSSLSSASATSPQALHLAALHGREELVNKFLLGYTKPDEPEDETTPIHLASAVGHHKIASILLSKGLDVNAKDHHGNTALHLASQYGHLLVTDELLRQGADVGSNNTEGRTPLHLACLWQSHSVVVKLLNGGAEVSDIDSTRCTTLHLASGSGCEDIVDALLTHAGAELQATLLVQQNATGRAPCHIAAACGHTSVLTRLLSGALQAHTRVSSNADTNAAVEDNKEEESLRSKITTLQDDEGNTPLHLATKNGFRDAVDELTGQGRARSKKKDQRKSFKFDSGANIPDRNGRLPIHLAVMSGDLELVWKICDEHERRKEDLNVFDGESQTPLHIAVRHRLIDVTEILLKEGAEPNVGDDESQTPLLFACKNGDMAIMDLLLDAGAEPLYSDSHGHSALHGAVEAQNLAMVQRLLKVIQELTGDGEFINMRDNDGNTILHLAAACESVEVLKFLLDADDLDPDYLRSPNHEGRSPLNIALGNRDMVHSIIEAMKKLSSNSDYPLSSSSSDGAGWADISTVKVLLEAIPSSATADKRGNQTGDEISRGGVAARDILRELMDLPSDFGSWDAAKHGPLLRLAAEKGVSEMAAMLTEPRIHQGQFNEFEPERRAAVLLAVQNGHTVIATSLLDKGTLDKEGKREDIRLAFLMAAQCGQLDLLNTLADRQPRVDHDTRATALQEACSRGHCEIAEFLLNEMSQGDAVDLEVVEKAKNSALGSALEKGERDVVELLLRRGADLDSSIDSGSTPLHQAAERGDTGMCRLLLNAKVSYLDARDSNGRTALYTAAWNVDEAMVDLLLKEFHADVEAADRDGWRPLHAAYNSSSVVQKLLEGNAVVDAKNGDGETPLYVAVTRRYRGTAEQLIKWGANPLAATSTGDTPLHAACASLSMFSTDLVEILLGSSVVTKSVDVPNSNGQTPLSLAVIYGQMEVVRIMLARQDIAINQTDGKGASLLRHAVKNEHVGIVEALLNDPRLSNLDLSSRHESLDDLLRGLLAEESDYGMDIAMTMLQTKPGIYKQFGKDPMFDLASSLDEVDLIDVVLGIRADLGDMRDEHGWSLEWIQHANRPANGLSDTPRPETVGLHFQVPNRWEEPKPTSGFSVLQDGDTSILSFSGRLSGGADPNRWWSSVHTDLYGSWPSLIRADRPIPPVGRFIFEMEILDQGTECIFAFGFSTRFAAEDSIPGWDEHSWGYHSDDGNKFHGEPLGTTYSSAYGKSDIVECHIDQSERTASFKRNGEDLGIAFEGLEGRLYPVVGMVSPGVKVATKFRWDFEAPPKRGEGEVLSSDDEDQEDFRRRFKDSRSFSLREEY